jgi:hypothetical protein
MKEMVLPEDETKIFNESLVTRLEDTNQQIKKWLTRWKPVIDHSMKRVNSFQAIGVFRRVRGDFSLAKQRVNFLQNELASRNNCTNFGDGKRDIQRVKITHILSQRGIKLRSTHLGYYSGVERTFRLI